MKQELIRKIVALEWDMFQAVQNRGGRASCQNNPQEFNIMRTSQMKAWSEVVLESYFYDLTNAMQEGRNLLSEKYAFMMEQTYPTEYMMLKPFLPEITHKMLTQIDEIVAINLEWQREVERKYPNLRAKGRPLTSNEDTIYATSFETYLRGELKTYSINTIKALYDYTLFCQKNNCNMAEINLQNMIEVYGYFSLEEANERLTER